MMMNHAAQKAIAQLVHAIRDEWDVAGVIAALGDARTAGKAEDVRAIADAAVAAALDARNRTPAVIPLAGPHWQTRAAAPKAQRLDRQRTCGVCSLDELDCKARPHSGHRFVPYVEVTRAANEARARRAGGAS